MSKISESAVALPTAADVDAAARRLAGVALRTPLISSPVLDAATGARVFLKAETLQRTGSFKFRGAYNKLSSIPAERKAGGVVAFSSGNHAQGVAHAAKLLGMPAAIVMPSDAPLPKRQRTAAFGGEVVLYNRDTEDREGIARALAEKRGATLVPPFDDPFIIAGQGTAGREIVEDLAVLGLKPDVVVIGASGGGLAAGISLAVIPCPISSRLICHVILPGMLVISASQIVPLMRAFDSRLPLRNERAVSSKPSGSAV